MTPGPGQESVWDYPRPPAVRATDRLVAVTLGGIVVCETRRALQVLETSHPPGWYLPLDDCLAATFVAAPGSSWCEWKGRASYLTVVGGLGGSARAEGAAWTYLDPLPGYTVLANRVALYPDRMDAVTVDGEPVAAQEGGFYGGWVTADVVGPFKGAPGTLGW